MSSGETAFDVVDKFFSIVDSLRQQPIPVFPTVSSTSLDPPDVITITDLLTYLRETLYSPIEYWPQSAQILADLSHGNGTLFSQLKNRPFQDHPPCETCTAPYSAACQGFNPRLGMTTVAIWCSDSPTQKGLSPEEFKNTTLAMLQEQSPHFGDIIADIKAACVAWDAQAKWQYDGKFDTITTAHPILWVGTSKDPVCPIRKYGIYLFLSVQSDVD
jgi:hypothetical protein